jgi:putative thiamine transport system permease protein
MAMILGPGTPPTLAVQLLRWFDAADLGSVFPAAAGAALQLLLVGVAILLWHLGERALARLSAAWLVSGGRGHLQQGSRWLGAAAALLVPGISLIAIASLVVWSLAQAWRFPALLPQVFTFDNWMRPGLDILRPFLTSLWVALGATAIALLLCFACLENERRHALHPTARVLWLIYLPLLVPQISFLFGTQTLFAWLGLDASAVALVWSHLLFVLPYVFLMLADPWRALDERYIRTGLCLGAGRARLFFAVMLPMLLRPILIAAAVGFSVSIALYLPTLFAGAGRFDSLTIEAVAASAGGDRRIAGVYGFLQAALPLAAFAAAFVLPAIAFRHRRGLRIVVR